MADVKAKVKTPKKKASKREKKDWIAAYILIADPMSRKSTN